MRYLKPHTAGFAYLIASLFIQQATMLIERPPRLFRLFFPSALFRVPPKMRGVKEIFLTFDDGPVPEVTPKVLEILDRYDVKATFFMVGDNVRRYPALLQQIRDRGHCIGNHTMHHLQGSHVTTRSYLRDIKEADMLIRSPLFRPPHGWMRLRQARAIKRLFRPVMYDLVTRDYSRRLTPAQVFENVRRYVRPGAIIVFHDSVKAQERVLTALPQSLEWLKKKGYTFGTLHRLLDA